MSAKKNAKPGLIKRFFSSLGPGIITGAADDDPSGIATCSIAVAQHGLALLWTALLTWPLMAFIQMMCARIGMVTGRGLIGAFHRRIPRPVLIVAAFALFAANSINTGADLAGMADAAEMLTKIHSHILVVVFGAGIAAATIFFRYHQIANILKWLTLVLFAYGITDIKTSKDAAQALFPLAGKFAATLFTLGLIGTGFLAIPTLTGSAAYALAEVFAKREGLDRPFRGAKFFYAVIIVATAVGAG